MPVPSENLPVPAAVRPRADAQELIIGRYAQHPGYAVHRERGAGSWLLLWTESGSGLVRQGGAALTAGPGDLVLLAQGLRHEYRVAPGADGWGFWWAHFLPRAHWGAWLAPYARGDGCWHVPGVAEAVRPRIDTELRGAHADARWPGQGSPPGPVPAGARPVTAVSAAFSRARELALTGIERVLLLATAREDGRRDQPGDVRVLHAEALLTADPAAPHTVAALAAAVDLSPSRLAHLFTQETGRSPMAALREARLRLAARLLETTALDVGQVAAASGFASPFHFSRLFRTRYDLPPREYRRAACAGGREQAAGPRMSGESPGAPEGA